MILGKRAQELIKPKKVKQQQNTRMIGYKFLVELATVLKKMYMNVLGSNEEYIRPIKGLGPTSSLMFNTVEEFSIFEDF